MCKALCEALKDLMLVDSFLTKERIVSYAEHIYHKMPDITQEDMQRAVDAIVDGTALWYNHGLRDVYRAIAMTRSGMRKELFKEWDAQFKDFPELRNDEGYRVLCEPSILLYQRHGVILSENDMREIQAPTDSHSRHYRTLQILQDRFNAGKSSAPH